jgi:hypothetical protein
LEGLDGGEADVGAALAEGEGEGAEGGEAFELTRRPERAERRTASSGAPRRFSRALVARGVFCIAEELGGEDAELVVVVVEGAGGEAFDRWGVVVDA